MTSTVTPGKPADLARLVTVRRITAADAQARWMRQRRTAARAAGYRGPLTRAELAASVTHAGAR